MKIEQKEKVPGETVAEISPITLNGKPIDVRLTNNPPAITAVIENKIYHVPVTAVVEEICQLHLKERR